MKLLLISGILLVLIDSIYLNSISSYFNQQISIIQNKPLNIDFYAAAICYIFLVFGLYYFIISEKKTILDAFLLGLVIYVVFETTNKTLFKNWTWKTVALDGIWGGILFALTTYLTYNIDRIVF